MKAALTTLNDHLDGRDWMVGRGVTVADLSCCSYLFYHRALHVRPDRLAEYRPLAHQYLVASGLEAPL